MSAVSARFSPPVQIILIIFYFFLVIIIKTIYDNNQKSQRFEKYNAMVNEVAHTLEIVEKHAKQTAQAVRSIEIIAKNKRNTMLKEHFRKSQQRLMLMNTKSKPP